jgi:tetratricopeptide (TPR) repeat protein/tRNA A-37 threonylcarbamoyl transferase component Bud32
MSTDRTQADQSAQPPNADATGVFEAPSPGSTEVLPSEVEGATAILPPPQAPDTATADLPPEPANPDVTAVLPPAALDGGTAIFESDNGATGEFAPGGTQGSATQPGSLRQASDATGEYATGADNDVGFSVSSQALDSTRRTAHDANVAAPPGGAKPTAAPAERCGRYVLKHFHAKGGMGEIWMAEDPEIGRSVALKRMLSHRPDQQRRFRIEAQVTGQLEHPGIVPIHELSLNEKGQPFYTMKFVRGRNLEKVIDDYHAAKLSQGGREVEQFRLLGIFQALCQTVAYAHSRGVLHRDLKPENVMLGSYGETLLLDWGIAKVMGQPEEAAPEAASEYVHLDSDNDTETRAGAIMGSLSYMSPEIAQGKINDADQRSDVFLLGGILYAMLTGKPPRQGNNTMALIKQAQTTIPPAPRKVKPEVPKPLDAICMKALALRPEDRYPSALALAEDVQRFAAGEPVSAYREGLVERAWRWARRHRTALLRSAAAVLTVALLAGGYLKYRDLEEKRAADLRAAEEKRVAAQKEADRLQELEKARGELKEFRRLADEARFYAATTEPVSENAPYFDPHEGEARARAALAVAANWGPSLDRLPLPDQHDSVKKELYDQYVLLAQGKIQQAGATDRKGDEDALALLDEAAKMREPSRGYHRLRAYAYQRLGDDKKAGEERQQAEAEKTPETALDRFLVGEQYRKEAAGSAEIQADGSTRKAWQADPKRMEEAIKQYRAALKDDPEHYWSYFQMGRCYMSLGRYPEAVEALGACVALRPDTPWGYSVRGSALALMKSYADAEFDLDLAVKKSSESLPSRLSRGVVYWHQKKTDQAMADFDAVLQAPKEKRLIEAAFYRGQLYLQLGKVAEALADFDTVVAERPGFKPVYQYRAQILIAQGKNDKALEDLNADLALSEGQTFDRKSWQGHGKRGHLLRFMFLDLPRDKRRLPENRKILALAVSELNKAEQLGGDSPRVFDDLGVMLTLSGKPAEGLAAYGRGLDRSPDDVLLLIKRGWVYANAGKRDKALADFAAAARAEPENAEAHTGAGYVRALEKSSPEAQREADLALLHGGEKYLILHNVACIYATLSLAGDDQSGAHKDAAIAVLRRAVKLWRQGGGSINEIEQIKGESAFEPLKDHPGFQDIIRGGS